VDPDGQNEVWRLRDGLGAALPGDSGQAAGLNRLSAALTEKRMPVSGNFATGARSAAQLASDVLSSIGVKLDAIENDKVAARVRVDALTSKELANGVDSDQEMSNLLVIEQAYAANAKVIEAVSSMLDSLMRI
jgi:flagellar hook-associated protein 1 FlgK